MTSAQPTTYTVEATNISHASENKIHDDEVARKLGFAGGLVPGVEVYAYATHPVVARWGRAWLERGTLEARFLKPLYDGRAANVAAAEHADGGLALTLASDGVLCATGHARVGHPAAPPSIADYQERPSPVVRPPAGEASLAAGTWLSVAPSVLTAQRANDYLRDIRERHDLYAREGVAHPGLLLRLCNQALRDNVLLAPWIHTGSRVQNFALARIGDDLSARARVARNYERKGHRLVDLDVILIANGGTVLAHVLHTAVYRLRQLAEAGA